MAEQVEKPEKVAAPERRGLTKRGVVTSNKMQKTVVVAVEMLKSHGKYERTVRLTRTFMAHDAENKCGIGDKVVIVESRPLSRHKRWRVMSIVSKAPVTAVAPEEAGS